MGPLIDEPLRGRVRDAIDRARAGGARLLTGGAEPPAGTDPGGFYVAPTLIANATNQMTAVREEIFGPVVVVVPFDDDEEAIHIANDSDFGLYSYVFSGDTGRAWATAQRLRSGNVGINSLQRNHEAPFGGFKRSGMGRELGMAAMDHYTEVKNVFYSQD